jgi:hypothetical protein
MVKVIRGLRYDRECTYKYVNTPIFKSVCDYRKMKMKSNKLYTLTTNFTFI